MSSIRNDCEYAKSELKAPPRNLGLEYERPPQRAKPQLPYSPNTTVP